MLAWKEALPVDGTGFPEELPVRDWEATGSSSEFTHPCGVAMVGAILSLSGMMAALVASTHACATRFSISTSPWRTFNEFMMMMMMTFITRRGEGQGKTKKERKATKSEGRGLEERASRALMRQQF